MAEWKRQSGRSHSTWLYTSALSRRNLKKYPGQYKVIRFEDLVRESEATLQEICTLLGETYVPEMLAMTGAPEHRAKLLRAREHDTEVSPLSDQHIGMYRRELDRSELAFMQSMAKSSLLEFGYTLEPVHFRPKQALAYAFLHWPGNLVRMAVWLGTEFLQQNLPGIFGRRPASHMVIKDAVTRSAAVPDSTRPPSTANHAAPRRPQ